jgi:hypothetical protein
VPTISPADAVRKRSFASHKADRLLLSRFEGKLRSRYLPRGGFRIASDPLKKWAQIKRGFIDPGQWLELN